MNIVATLPPTNRQSTAKIGNENANDSVDDKIVGDGSVGRVVSREHDLVLFCHG